MMTNMVGAEGKVDYYVVEDVPHTMYFNVRYRPPRRVLARPLRL
jgi:hypothetical protein